jgi:cell division protein FtsA
MARPFISTGLDIGSSAIRMAVGQQVFHEKKGLGGEFTLLGAVEVPSQGISKGAVTSVEDAVASISKCLELAERMTGQPINEVWVGIGGTHIACQESKGVIGVGRTDGEIREEDVHRAVEAARTVATPNNHDILHVIPKTFTVDGQRGVKDPVGMTGIRLEVDTLIVQGLSSQVKNVSKCVYRTGLNIREVAFSLLALGDALVSAKQKELGCAVVNIGAQTTSLMVFEEGEVLHIAVLPIGADHITSDIAIALRTSLEIAEAIKRAEGTALRGHGDKHRTVSVQAFGGIGEETCTHAFLADVVRARAEEIFEKVDDELKRVQRSGLLPAGVFLTGGGSKLQGMAETAKTVLRLPITIATPLGVQAAIEQVNDPAFSTAVSLVKWAQDNAGDTSMSSGFLSDTFGHGKKQIGQALGAVKKLFGGLIR